MAKWISFFDALEAYLDRQDISGHGAHCLKNAKHFHSIILDKLIDGEDPLVAKSQCPNSFHLRFISEREEIGFPLLEDGVIPGIFWNFFKEATERSERTPMFEQNPDHAPTSYDGTFKFVLTDMKDGGTVEAYAEQVCLLRDAVTLLPRGRGRSLGNQYEDTEAVEFAVSELRAGRPWHEVIPLAVAMMAGSSEDKSRRNRLVQTRLKPLGFFPPARKRNGSKFD